MPQPKYFSLPTSQRITTITTKEDKNNIIEKQLLQLLKGLQEAKRKEALSFVSLFEYIEMLNDGIKALENTQFASVDDFDSVKELLELEQFFSVRLGLRDFAFPKYQSLISPVLLAYAGVEVQLDTLEMKAYDLDHRGHHFAATEANSLVFNLRNLNRWFFSEKKISYVDYKIRALQAVNESRPTLEQHRGYKQILGNLLIFIATLGTGQLIHKALHGEFLFFKQTDSAKQLDALTQTINSYSLQ